MFFEQFGFSKLKFFTIFCEYFIGIMLVYILVVFVLIISNIYGILIQKVIAELVGFILLLSCFLILKDIVRLNFLNLYSYQYIYFGFNKFIDFNLLSCFTKIIVCFFSSIYFFIISSFLKDYKLIAFEYILLLLFAVLGLILLCSTNDFLTTFLAIELISLCSYLLASFRKMSSYSLEAGIKYLIIGAISSSFFLMGSSLIYAYTASITFVDIKFLLTNSSNFLVSPYFFYYVAPDLILSKNLSYLTTELKFFEGLLFNYNTKYTFFIEMGMVFIILSIFIKLALAPFHVWSLEVYEGAPTISTFFFSTLTKLSFFVFLSRFCFTFYIYYAEFWIFYNAVIGFLSILLGSFGGIKQKKIKTLLAYSSISHMGYGLLSFNSFSILGLEILYFYLFTYIISNIIIWYIILGLQKIQKNYIYKLSKNIGDFVLLGKSNKFIAFSLSLAFFSLAGIPPLLGFLAKFGVFLVLIVHKFYILCLLIILCSLISTFYYIRLVKILYFENLLVGKLYSFKTDYMLIFCFFVFLLIFLFVKPTFLFLLIHKMVLFYNLEYKLTFVNTNSQFLYLNTNFLFTNYCLIKF